MRSQAAAVEGTLIVRALAYATTAAYGPEDPGTGPLAGCSVNVHIIQSAPSVTSEAVSGAATGPQQSALPVTRGTTGADGRAQFSLPPGRYGVTIQPPDGYEAPTERWVNGSKAAGRDRVTVMVVAGGSKTIHVRMRPKSATVRVAVRVEDRTISDPHERESPAGGVRITAWQRGAQVAEAKTDEGGRCELMINAPGMVEIRPAEELTHGNSPFVPDRRNLFVPVPPGTDQSVRFTYLPAPAEIRVGAKVVERSAEGERSRPLAGVRFQLAREDAEEKPIALVTTAADPGKVFSELNPGLYVLTVMPPAGVRPRSPEPLPSPLLLEVRAGEVLDLQGLFVFEPAGSEAEPEAPDATPSEADERGARTDPNALAQTPSDRRPSMPEIQEPLAGGELAIITIRIQFPGGAAGIVASDPTKPQEAAHLEGTAAVAHLLNVDMRGELESRIEEEAQEELGVEDARVELLMVSRSSIEVALAVFSAVALVVKNADEIMEAGERIFRRALGAVRWVIQRMPRAGPLPAYVVTGYWAPGAAMSGMRRQSAAGRASEEADRAAAMGGPPAPSGDQPAAGAAHPDAQLGAVPQADHGQLATDQARRRFGLAEPASLLPIYLLLVNLALIATLIVMVFRQR